MNQDIRKAVEIINQRIENLERIKSLLLEEFGAGATLGPIKTVKRATDTEVKRLGTGTPHNGHSGSTGSRKDELIRFLTTHGPCKRAKINSESGIPVGTVANLLNGNDFVRRTDGTWDLRDPSSAPQETTH